MRRAERNSEAAKKFAKLTCVVSLASVGLSITANAADTLVSWAQSEESVSVTSMVRNISPAGTAPGVVIASPAGSPNTSSVNQPNYYFHWIRDAALTMDTVVSLYIANQDPQKKSALLNMLTQYVDFSRRNQQTPNRSGPADGLGLGEPKFNVDGSAFTGNWGRPQNDGPALRALTIIHFANQLIKEGQANMVRQKIYDGHEPSQTVVKIDLDYVAAHWQDTSFDLWEEIYGEHFFTRIVQRRAMIEGAAFAASLGDFGAANFYRQQAQSIGSSLAQFWSAQAGYVGASLNTNGAKDKTSNLDVGVILGSLRGYANDTLYSPGSDAILVTAEMLRRAFANGISGHPGFGVNGIARDSENGILGTAIGRYPEDTYNGLTTQDRGNPWVIATEAYAELCYRAATEWSTSPKVPITNYNLAFLAGIGAAGNLKAGDTLTPQDPRFRPVLNAMVAAGDNYLRRVRFHANGDGSLSEEINRDNGYMQGANNLTWNYAAFLTAITSRPAPMTQ